MDKQLKTAQKQLNELKKNTNKYLNEIKEDTKKQIHKEDNKDIERYRR
jgi:F0F1-type ATP synthase membrane subunit b/b'